MDTKKQTEQANGNRFTSGVKLSESEFKKGIKDAEEGPLFTVQESMTHFESWLKNRI
ncbi:MAG: hypothetical protein WEA58_07255 [Balneolaceae bacterium]